jgi:hypothetical protein
MAWPRGVMTQRCMWQAQACKCFQSHHHVQVVSTTEYLKHRRSLAFVPTICTHKPPPVESLQHLTE